jgi:hypothetical protein
MSKTQSLIFQNPSDGLSARKDLVKTIQASNLDDSIKNKLVRDITSDNYEQFVMDTTDPNVTAALQAAYAN